MNSAKKIRHFIQTQENPGQVQVLKDLAAALELGQPFNLRALYEIDMRYFDVAIELLKDWRFDHHIASRSKLVERLTVEIMYSPAAPTQASNLTETSLPPALQPTVVTEDSTT